MQKYSQLCGGFGAGCYQVQGYIFFPSVTWWLCTHEAESKHCILSSLLFLQRTRGAGHHPPRSIKNLSKVPLHGGGRLPSALPGQSHEGGGPHKEADAAAAAEEGEGRGGG